MKLFTKAFLLPVLAVLLIAVSDSARSSKPEVSSTVDQPGLNADLRHLISILDVNGTDSGLTATNPNTTHNVGDQHESSTVVSPLPPTQTVIIKKRKFRKIRKPVSNSSLVVQPTTVPQTSSSELLTTTSTEIPPTTTTQATSFPTTSQPPALDVSSTTKLKKRRTTAIPIIKDSNLPIQQNADRREDVNMDEISPPSQVELAQQLALLNSLLTSLGDNATATASESTSSVAITPSSPVTPDTPVVSASESLTNQQSTPPSEPSNAQTAANSQTLAVLNSIFGGGDGGVAATPQNNADATAALLGLQGHGPSSDSNVATRQIEPGTEGAKALSEFLFQAAAIEAQQRGNKNLNTNLHEASAAAASNQISSLVSLLGTLNAISPQGQSGPGNLSPGQNQGFQQSQLTDPQQQVLAVLQAQLQQQQRHHSGAPHSLTDLFGQLPNLQGAGGGQPFDLGSLLAQGQGALGGGGGILSTIGSGITSLGSSMIATFSNILSGSGIGGKPRVRGVDTRLGLGYRFGDAADAQIMWDVGPQLFTEPVKNEQRSPTMTKKSQIVDQDETDKLIQSLIGIDKPMEGLPAAKRVLQLQTKKSFPNAPKKPFSLLGMWNAGKEPQSKSKQDLPVDPSASNNKFQIPHQLLTPPIPLNLNEADRLQMARNKSFKKRSSSSTQLKNYYSKPDDNPLSGHSTLTAYEQMLIEQGKDLGIKFKNMMLFKSEDEEEPTPSTGRPKRRKTPQPTSRVFEEEDEQDDQLPTAEYGNNFGLSESATIQPKKKKGKPSRGKNKKKRPSNMRPRPLNDKHKWKPRPVVDEDEDSQGGESQKDEKPLHRDEYRSSSKEQHETRKRPQGNKSRERDSNKSEGHEGQDEHKTPCSKLKDLQDLPRPTPPIEPESSHSLARPKYNDNHDAELDDEDFKSQSDPDADYEDYEPEPTDRPRDEAYSNESRKRKKSSREKTQGSREKPYHDSDDRPYKNDHPKDSHYDDDGSKDYEIRHNQRPRHKDTFRDTKSKERDRDRGRTQEDHKYNPRPPSKKPQTTKDRKKSPPQFSLARIFHYWMGTGRRQKTSKKSRQPSSERDRGHKDDSSSYQKYADYDYERFTYNKPDLSKSRPKPMSRSDDPFHARNKKRPLRPSRRRRPSTSTFNHKISSLIPLKRRGGSSSSPYDFIQTYSPQINPEANDSFLRRNQVAVNNRLKEAERQKLIQSQSPEFQSASSTINEEESSSHPSPTLSTKSSPSSVMAFVKNYFASKTGTKSAKRPSSQNPNTRHSPNYSGNPQSISTLAKLISNPSVLNPLKMLPIRRNRIRQPTPTQSSTSQSPSPQVRHKLALVNGKLQILNVTVPTTTTTESPIIHIGDDMSFEELTQVLGAVKKRRKQKIKLKTTTSTTKIPQLQSKKDYDYEDGTDEADFVVKAEKKVDNDLEGGGDGGEDYDSNDGLKGIFIDIESGEVNVLKPVAELTSFLPHKQEEPPTLPEATMDELDDEDGDGVADKEIQRKEEIFSGIQSELKKNYDKMKAAHELSEAKKRRKEAFVAKGLDESMDVVSKYFDMVQDEEDGGKKK